MKTTTLIDADIKHGAAYWTTIKGKPTLVAVLGCKRTREGFRYTVTTLGVRGRVLSETLAATDMRNTPGA